MNAISEQKWLFCAGEWPNWLPTVGHTLAKTHIYKSKYTSLRTYWLIVIHPLCGPQSSAWSLTLLSLDLDQLYAQRSYLAVPTLLGNDATVNTGGSLAFPFLLLSDQSYSFCCGRSKFSAATMSHIQIINTLCGYCWHVVKPFTAVLVTTVVQVVVGLGAMGVPYNGWVWMCCGLTMAGTCAKHWPCYWSQTTLNTD